MKTQVHINQGFRWSRVQAEPIIVNVIVGGFLAAAFLTNIFEIARMLMLGGTP